MNNRNNRTGTSFKGYLYAELPRLVEVFGSPMIPDKRNIKIDAEWIIQTPHGVGTIYNYKNGNRYLSENGIRVEQIKEWHVGGHNTETYKWIKAKVFGTVELLI